MSLGAASAASAASASFVASFRDDGSVVLIPEGGDDKEHISFTASFARSLDAVVVLGGGAPTNATWPPEYVRTRCDVAAAVHRAATTATVDDEDDEIDHNGPKRSGGPSILCISAGTAHVSQTMTAATSADDGRPSLPLWEGTASAGYLLSTSEIPSTDLYVETTSYDTLSNAYFARTSHTDPAGWRRLLVITNAFHAERTRAIFDWVFSLPRQRRADDDAYQLFHVSCPDTGLTAEELRVRAERERRSAENVRTRLAPRITTMTEMWRFLTTEHDFYTAKSLVDAGRRTRPTTEADVDLRASYGERTTSREDVSWTGDRALLYGLGAYALVVTVVLLWASMSGRLLWFGGVTSSKKDGVDKDL